MTQTQTLPPDAHRTAPGRPKLLFLSHRLPFPPHNGAALRSLNILRLLARHYEIHALCFDRLDAASRSIPLQSRLDNLAPLGRFENFPIAQQGSRWRLTRDHALSLVTGLSYIHFVHESRAFDLRLAEVLSQHEFDLVHVDSLDLARALRSVRHLPCVVTHHNVESALLERRAAAESNVFRRWYMRHQARLLRRDELAALPNVALNVAVSEQDASVLRALAPGSKVIVVPNGVDTEFFRPGNRIEEPTGCVFVGGTNYFPNRDALDWFVAEVAPELRRLGAPVNVTWVGRATAREMRRFDGSDGVRLVGYVDDVRPYLDQAACFIAPLRVGGGTRLKLLDAWAMGKAIVSTSLGSEGLRVREGENMLVRDDARGFAAAIVRVCTDRSLRQELERGARATAETEYAWPVLEAPMIAEYRRAARR